MADEEILDPEGYPEAQEDVPEEVEESVDETPEPEAEEEQEPSEEPQELTKEQLLWIAEQQRIALQQEAQKQHNKLAYQMRTTAREKKNLERKLEDLEAAIMGRRAQQDESEEDSLPDKESNPGAYLIAKIEQLERRLASKDEEQTVEKQIKGHLGELMSARELAVQFRANNPDAYDAALVHLVNVTREELLEDYPDADEQDINQMMAKGIAGKMVEWKGRGLNPGEQLVKMALRRGFAWQPPQQEAPAVKKPSADQQVRMQQARQQKAKTIGSVPGSAPGGKGNLNRALAMDEDAYIEESKKGGLSWADIVKQKGVRG